MSEQKLNEIIYQLRYNYPAGVSTVGKCSQGCGNPARGSGVCAFCTELELAELTGKPFLAREFHDATRRAAELLDEMSDLVANPDTLKRG